ncbi:hypothetical protein WALBB_340003 [Wolbachia pipientis wAlbB]|nr:hypothetical protein WALBB_340003 [Wolbachia pipientis wAlbB]
MQGNFKSNPHAQSLNPNGGSKNRRSAATNTYKIITLWLMCEI